MGVPTNILLDQFSSQLMEIEDRTAVSAQDSMHGRSWYEFHATVDERYELVMEKFGHVYKYKIY